MQFTHQTLGDKTNFLARNYNTSDIVFNIPTYHNDLVTVYLKITSKEQILIPIYAGTQKEIFENINRESLFLGIYFGVILIMLLYNLFVYFSIKDTNYIYYVIYIFTVGLTQASLKGIGYQYLWHGSLFLTDHMIFWSAGLVGIATALFAKQFLNTRKTLPLFDKILTGFVILDSTGIILSFFSFYFLGYQIINIVALVGGFTILAASMILTFRGYRPAKFFLIAWSFFLIGVVLYVLGTYSLIPYTLFTKNILLIGSAIEIALLSFALADKINVYRQEKEQSQLEVLRAVREKEDFVRKQNIILESKVQQRTLDLQQANRSLRQANISLNIAMENQKKTESKLVHAEKMASLGQLTAGIAHEINNPINFVKSNIKPLARDIDDLNTLIAKYKEITKENLEEKLQEIEAFIQEIDLDILNEEIPSLLSGIEDGATRTAEIVRGLRIFSRVDENALKKADIHAGIDSTLVLLNNIIPYNLTIEKDYDQIPLIDCYPGKLNQVFMNLLTNAVQALNAKPEPEHEHIGIKTINKGDLVEIHISDTGMGIPEDIQNKIFDPFFTTKDVGEGTGLGLSMSYSIIEEHGGEIKVDSQVGKGTKFIITLPVSQDDVIAGKGD